MPHHHHPPETTFRQRAWTGTKKHAAGAIIASILGIVTGSIVPMLEQWHSDKQFTDSIAAVQAQSNSEIAAAEARGLTARNELKSDVVKLLDDFKREQESRDQAQWSAIQKKKDKTP